MHVQIERALRDAVRSGRLARGSAVPSTRTLAGDLGVSRGVIVEAYEQLVAEGYLASRPRSRTVVTEGGQIAPAPVQERTPAPPGFDFRPGLPDVTRFPREEWGRCVRRVLRALRAEHLGYGDPRGAFELRAALADYLGRVRGVVGGPDRVIVCTGFAQALGVIARALAGRGVRRLAMEDPGHPDQRRIVSDAGLVPIAVPVDDRGLRVDLLDRVDAQAALVSAAHQFPTGSVLAPERRHDLLAWAGRRDAVIVEDDYDAEYRYDRAPVGALQGLAPDRVVYAGSASKILAPGLRLGWLVSPPALVGRAAEIKKYADLGTPALEQLVYAEFLRSGELDRHLRRMRRTYGRRRDALLAALARRCPGWKPQGAAAGLHLVVELPRGLDEAAVTRHAATRSVRVYPLGEYRVATHGPPALVLGYGGLAESAIRAGVSRLAASGQGARRTRPGVPKKSG